MFNTLQSLHYASHIFELHSSHVAGPDVYLPGSVQVQGGKNDHNHATFGYSFEVSFIVDL